MSTPRSSATVVAAAVAGLLVSLGVVLAAGRSAQRAPEPEPVVEAGRTEQAFARDREALLREVPPAQAAALADRQVTAAEYEAAVRDAMRCLERDLVAARPELASRPPQLSEPTWSEDRFTFSYGLQLTVDDLDPRPLDRACQERFSRQVEALFHLQRWVDPAYVARSATTFHACLDRARLPGRATDPPRARFRRAITHPDVDDQEAIEARKCIGALPSIGDLTP